MSSDQEGLASDATGDRDRKRRRIDVILDEDYLDGIEDAPVATLRQMRDDCREEEGVISYARRVIQGKIDLLFSEVQRRRDDGTATDALGDVPRVLADERRPSSDMGLRSRAVTTHVPDREELRRAGERSANMEPLGDLGGYDDVELAKRFGKLAVEEERISEVRSVLLERIDTLNDEIARRYRDGDANVSDVLRSEKST